MSIIVNAPMKASAWSRGPSPSASTCSGSCVSRGTSPASAYSTSFSRAGSCSRHGSPAPPAIYNPRNSVNPMVGRSYSGATTPRELRVARSCSGLPRLGSFQPCGQALQRDMPNRVGIRLDVHPGDVFSIKGNDQVAQLGAHGGFMGHVVVVLSDAQLLPASLPEYAEMRKLLKVRSTCNLWKVRTLESTRSNSGLHVADLLLRSDDQTDLLLVVGELSINGGELSAIDSETVEVWQSPFELRRNFRVDLMAHVVADMKDQEADWSLSTAARALLTRTSDLRRSKRGTSLKEIRDCWDIDPICTSVVVVFWQRYLFRFAQEAAFQNCLGQPLDPAKLILKWMPLKSDGVLPGALTQVMHDCGWVHKTKTPILLAL